MLNDEAKEAITLLVRSGFYEPDEVIEIVCEEMYEPGQVAEADVTAAVEAESEAWEDEKKRWPAVTDCDKLDQVFENLNAKGIVALQNAGYTQSDGFDDFREAYEQHPRKSSVIGYCFYHGQDLERAVAGQGLYLAFGPLDADEEATKGPAIGEMIREELEKAGFAVEWDGTFQQRILIPRIVWQRR
jgi:uncharacterized protein DUF6891